MYKEVQLEVVFYRSAKGNEPVREWLRGLPKEDRRTIGIDIKTVQFGWPLGMPLGVAAWLRQEVTENAAEGFGHCQKAQISGGARA